MADAFEFELKIDNAPALLLCLDRISKSKNMPTAKKSKYSNLANRVSRMNRRSLLIVAAFVLVFVSFGTWYVQRSLAYGYYGYPCASFKIYHYSNLTSCVKPIQFVLQRAGAGSTCPSGYCDGVDGPVTQAAIVRFGNWHGIQNNGEVGSRTWYWLCAYARYQTPTASSEMGCDQTSSYGWIQ